MNDWLSNVYSHKSLPRHYAEQGNVGSLLLSLTLFAAFIKPKMGFHYWTQLAQNIKKNHSVYKQKRNESPFVREMHSSVFNEFWLVFCLFCTVYLEGLVVYCENWVLFVISHQKTFWVFWFTQTSFYVHQKTQKVFWFEMPNSHCCAMKLNSHSALLNLLDSQCKTAENQSKLIAQRAVHFSRSWQHVPFWFFHGKDTFFHDILSLLTKWNMIFCLYGAFVQATCSFSPCARCVHARGGRESFLFF